MASLPSPEQTARAILDIFVGHFNRRPEDVLRVNNFLSVWHSRGLEAGDFKPGMEFAATQNWVEILPQGDAFRLTALGFSEA
ncbi:hypothetical protein [Pseudomonas extremaustralis]|uniref:Uncharacterized protein n=1 Tax=Pseudomonas extremaustralis TaxID=359110 RepID=A0A5C5QNF0_9PSED|nr:hypothetical protein [Pseudomonas extremaustralis]EZI29585.1 hypothetical protein PE143B_0104000 [Pseudomonas extremaustralis 14-3 substr. 14-3b]TWS07053.1 hypothetical protein FIV36_03820 [Pseudomonas extremaustralis]SDF89993.1 hypothetical protein SAMN05216591_4304 [Pseudomonas extremaustralis]